MLSLSFNPSSIPFIITAILCAFLAFYLIKQKISYAATHLVVLLLLIMLWSGAYSFELNFVEKTPKIFAYKIIYIPLSLIPVVFLYFVYRYAHPSPRKLPASAFLLLIPPAVFTALMFTNELHGLMFSNMNFRQAAGVSYTFITPEYGIAMRISSVYSYAVMLAAFAYIVYVSVKTTRLISSQVIILIFSAIVPVFTNAMYYLKGFADSSVDYTPASLLFSSAMLTYLVTGMRQFYLQPLARDLIIRNTADGTILLDSENRILDINPITENIFSVKKEDAIGKDCSSLSGALASLNKNECVDELSIRKRLYSVSCIALSSDNGTYLGQMISIKDITEAKRSENKIRELAFIDPLTGLPNHTFMMEELRNLLQKRENSIAILLIDPGKVEHINSSYGYETGDALIRKTAELIKPYTSESDILARMKGDEFVIIRSISSAAGSAMFLAEQIIRTFQQPLMIHDKCISASVNIGICTSYAAGEDAQTLIHKASVALGQAKKTKEHFAFYSEQNEQEITQRNKLFNALHTALDNKEFSLDYQPQYSLETNRLLGAEALLRWTNPEIGSVPPSQFVGLLEDSGMIVPVGNWVIEESARQFKAWTDKGLKLPKFSINLSVRQFDNDFLVPYILQTLDSKKIPRHCLEVEVTESIAVLAESSVVSKIHELSKAGVRIAVDDFGSGFSSLTYFKYLNVNTLKIDREITLDIHNNICSMAIFESLKLICDSLGVDIVAEYTETTEQVKKLISLGCRNFQGYYFSKPLSPAVFERYVRSLSDVHADKLFSRTVVDAAP